MTKGRGPVRLLTVIASSELGGAERSVAALLAKLQGADFELSIACHGRGPILEEYRSVAANVRSFDLVRPFRPATIRALAAWMCALRAEVVHSHLWTADLIGGLAARLARVPVRVASVRGHYFQPVEISGGRRWRRALLSRTFRGVYRLFDRVVAVAPSIALDLEHRPGLRVRADRIQVIVNGIDGPDLARRARATDSPPLAGRPLIVCVANFVPIKGHGVLLEALRAVAQRHPHLGLVLVGDGPERTSIEAYAHAHGLTSRVTFTGARPDTPLHVAIADLVVLASFSEGTPRALLEALALEKPVVATAVGGVRDLVVDGVTGRAVPAGDPAALAEAMISMLSDTAGAKEMARRGRDHVARRFSLDEAAARTRALYANLLDGSRS